MLKRLDNNQFEYETEKKKMIFQKNKEEWEYKDEETLEIDSSDIFDSTLENFRK